MIDNNIGVNKIKNFIGIAQKAGKIKSGDLNVLTALSKQEVKLIILANDVAESVKKELKKYNTSEIPVIVFADKIQLGEIIGKSPRGMLGITDEGFAAALIDKFNRYFD